MLHEEEGKEMGSQMFGLYAETREDNARSYRGWWIGIAAIVLAVSAVIWFHISSTPYDEQVRHLHNGMSLQDVCRDLDFELDPEVVKGVSFSSRRSDNGGPYYFLNIDPTHQTVSYKKPGADKPLILKFDDYEKLKQWCFKEKCHNLG